MTTIAAILSFVFGTIIGSFLSVVIHRVRHNKKGIIFSRSICPSCKKPIKARHLIPVFSWLYLRGKCAYCGTKISSHYIALELLTGLLFLAAFFQWNFIETIPSVVNPEFLSYTVNWEIFSIFIFYLIEFSLLMAIFFYDLMYKEIPDQFSLTAIVVAIAGGLIFGTPIWTSMLIGGAVVLGFFLIQFILSRGTWIGGGDLRLGLFMGVLLGTQKGVLALILSYLFGAVISLILLSQKKVHRKSAIPFGPFLIAGTLVSIFFGQEILDWYFGSLLI